MPLKFLSDARAAAGRRVSGDEDADGLLQKLRAATGQDWIVDVRERRVNDGLFRTKVIKDYDLLVDAHGEWEVMSMSTERGSSIAFFSDHSREHVMNFIRGYLCGMHDRGANLAA